MYLYDFAFIIRNSINLKFDKKTLQRKWNDFWDVQVNPICTQNIFPNSSEYQIKPDAFQHEICRGKNPMSFSVTEFCLKHKKYRMGTLLPYGRNTKELLKLKLKISAKCLVGCM